MGYVCDDAPRGVGGGGGGFVIELGMGPGKLLSLQTI